MSQPGTIDQDGRLKAYRPLSAARRRRAFDAGLAAYERGDAFLAHEILEPAWMGSRVLAERELYQALIKLAAAEVHAVRGNPTGVAKNLRGALARLEKAQGGTFHGGLDLGALHDHVSDRIRAIEGGQVSAGLPLVDPRLPRDGAPRPS